MAIKPQHIRKLLCNSKINLMMLINIEKIIKKLRNLNVNKMVKHAFRTSKIAKEMAMMIVQVLLMKQKGLVMTLNVICKLFKILRGLLHQLRLVEQNYPLINIPKLYYKMQLIYNLNFPQYQSQVQSINLRLSVIQKLILLMMLKCSSKFQSVIFQFVVAETVEF